MERKRKLRAGPSISTFSVTKGGKVQETYALFATWDLSVSLDQNLIRFQHENPILASTGAWLKQMGKIFHARFGNIDSHTTLIRLAHAGTPLENWSPILLWHLCLRELLLADFLESWLYPRKQEGLLRVRADDVRGYLKDLRDRGLVTNPWAENTVAKMTSALPGYAADFGLLRGKAVREIAAFHLPDDALLYVLHAMAEETRSSERILNDVRWRRFLLARQELEQELLRLHQLRRLRFEVAGTLVSLELPSPSLDAYVDAWVARRRHQVEPSRMAT